MSDQPATLSTAWWNFAPRRGLLAGACLVAAAVVALCSPGVARGQEMGYPSPSDWLGYPQPQVNVAAGVRNGVVIVEGRLEGMPNQLLWRVPLVRAGVNVPVSVRPGLRYAIVTAGARTFVIDVGNGNTREVPYGQPWPGSAPPPAPQPPGGTYGPPAVAQAPPAAPQQPVAQQPMTPTQQAIQRLTDADQRYVEADAALRDLWRQQAAGKALPNDVMAAHAQMDRARAELNNARVAMWGQVTQQLTTAPSAIPSVAAAPPLAPEHQQTITQTQRRILSLTEEVWEADSALEDATADVRLGLAPQTILAQAQANAQNAQAKLDAARQQLLQLRALAGVQVAGPEFRDQLQLAGTDFVDASQRVQQAEVSVSQGRAASALGKLSSAEMQQREQSLLGEMKRLDQARVRLEEVRLAAFSPDRNAPGLAAPPPEPAPTTQPTPASP